MTWLTALAFALAIGAALVFVPMVRSAAIALGIVDQPDRDRKLQGRPVALGGGLAVFMALTAAFIGTIWFDRNLFSQTLGVIEGNWFVLFGAAAAMLVVGLVDDAWTLRGRQKLLLQFLIISVLVGNGTLIEELSILGMEFHLGFLAVPLTIIWLLASVNALNLIDGADGMATTAGCIICAGFGFLSLRGDPSLTPIMAFALAGALLGFLVFNRPPASIYLGDAGSMTIGLCVGVLAVWSSVKETTVLASAPVAILAIPLFDSTAAILRRWLTGRSIYTTDRAHLHHLLQERFGPVKMLVVVAILCGTTTSLAVLSVILHQPWLSIVGVILVLALLILTRSFGHAEFRLLVGRATHFAQSFATAPRHHRRLALQGSGNWETIWEPLVGFAKNHDLSKIKIDLNLSWIQEGYHAMWQSNHLPEKTRQLSISLPFFTTRSDGSQMQIGRLEIIAHATDQSVYQQVASLADMLEDLGPQIDVIVGKLEQQRGAASAATPTSEDNGARQPMTASSS